MFNRLDELLSKVNYNYSISDSAKRILSEYVKTQNDEKTFNDLLVKVVGIINELRGYGNIQNHIKYPIENEDIEKLLLKIFNKYLDLEKLLNTAIIAKLSISDKNLLDQFKKDLKVYENVIEKEAEAVNNYNNAVSIVADFFAKTPNEIINSVPQSIKVYKEFCNIRNIFDNINIPNELEYRVNVKKYDSLIENMTQLKNVIQLNDEYIKEFESKCSSIRAEYVNELFKITNSKNGIAYAKIPLTGEAEIFSKYSNEFNSLFVKNENLKEYEIIIPHIKFWEQETAILNNDVKIKNEKYHAKEKVKKIQKMCLDCATKVIDDLKVNLVEVSLSKIKLPLNSDYNEEFNNCFTEYKSITPEIKQETSSDSKILTNFQFLDAFHNKIKAIISQHENISLFFRKTEKLNSECEADISSNKPVGGYSWRLDEIERLYLTLKSLNNNFIENTYKSIKETHKKACDKLDAYRKYKADKSARIKNFFISIYIGLFILVVIAVLAAYSYWGAIFLRSGAMNPFPQWFFKIANIYWFHHWANWGGNVWPVINLFVWAFEGLWVAITWLVWAIVWLLLMILCGLAYVICYVLVPAVAGILIGGLFIGLNTIRTKDDDSVVMILICVLTFLAFITLYVLCFAL